MTAAAGGSGASDPEPLAPQPRPLAGGAVVAWKTPSGIRLQLLRQVLRSERAVGLFIAVAWAALLLAVDVRRFPGVLLDWAFDAWLFPSLLLGFWILAQALRVATFEADARGVRVVRSGLFGRRMQEWTKDELKDIREEVTRVYQNDVSRHVLVFERADGRKVRLHRGMSGRSLNAIAAELRIALGLALRKPPPEGPASS